MQNHLEKKKMASRPAGLHKNKTNCAVQCKESVGHLTKSKLALISLKTKGH